MNEDKKEAFNSILNAVKKHIGDICAAALTSYIVMSLINIVINDTKTDTLDFVTGVNGFVTIAVFIILWICFSAISFLNTLGRKLLYFLMLLSAIVFACLVVADNGDNVYISAGISAIVVFFLYYTVKSGILFKNKIIINYKIAFAVVAAAFAVISVWMSINTINRYRGFSASNFDFGIFAQLFENMAKHGSTVISVERNEMMSHFFNHFSPIYYVLLPIYMLFRRPEALLGIQAVFITASAFPLFLIGKKMGLKPLTVMFLGLIAIVAPAFVSPMFYDFHENKFLPFFMLWFIYFFMDGKYKVSYVFMLLTLMIKEDAAIYVIFTLIYFMLVHKQVKNIYIFCARNDIYAQVWSGLCGLEIRRLLPFGTGQNNADVPKHTYGARIFYKKCVQRRLLCFYALYAGFSFVPSACVKGLQKAYIAHTLCCYQHYDGLSLSA